MATFQSRSSSPRVAVITVSYGSDDELAVLLPSIAASTSMSLEVVVADNKPGHGSIASLAARHGATYLPLASNEGYGAAINAAAARLTNSIAWILVSNPDVVFSPGAIDALVRTGESDGRIGTVGPSIVTATGGLYPSARAVPSLRTGVGHALFANLWIDNPWSRAYRNVSSDPTARRDAGWLSGACVLIRRTSFEEIGGFDAGYFMYFEDVDLGYRLGKAGYRNVFEPAAGVIHTGAHSTAADSERMIEAHHASARRFLSKKYSGVLLWPMRVTLIAGLAIRSRLMRRR